MKHGIDYDLEAMANELLDAVRPKLTAQQPKAAPKAPKVAARPSLASLQPTPEPARRYTIGFSAQDANALVRLIEWVNAYADATGNPTLDVNISWCPGTSSWLVWCMRYDSERPTLAGAVKAIIAQIEDDHAHR